MIDGSLTVEEMRLIVAMQEIYEEVQGQPLKLKGLEQHLKSRGFTVGNGMTREINKIEVKIAGSTGLVVKLLEHCTKGYLPSSMGLEIVKWVRDSLGTLENIFPTFGIRSVVRVGMTNTLATNMFPRVLKESTFLADFPNVDIEVLEGEPHELVTLLHSRVEFAVGPKGVNNGFKSQPLCRWKRVLLYNRNSEYKKPISPNVSVETLQEWLRDEIVLIPAPLIIPQLSRFLKTMRTGRTIMVPQASQRRQWVERGIGVAISNEESEDSTSILQIQFSPSISAAYLAQQKCICIKDPTTRIRSC